jgi:hypothetical protein
VATVAFAVVDTADGWLDIAHGRARRTSADFALVHRLGADRDRAAAPRHRRRLARHAR